MGSENAFFLGVLIDITLLLVVTKFENMVVSHFELQI